MKRETKIKLYVIGLIIAGFYFGLLTGSILMKHKVEKYQTEINNR